MATFKEISSADIKTSRSFLNQLVDVIQEDISGSTTRQKYQVFVTGGLGPGVTSSLFHTVHDQDFTLQTANPVFDMTVGLNRAYVAETMSWQTSEDDAGKLYFPSQSLMLREKINIYQQYSQLLLGDSSSLFTAPFSTPNSDGSDDITNALFISYKRLFARDAIKRETYAMKFYASSSYVPYDGSSYGTVDGNLDTWIDTTIPLDGAREYKYGTSTDSVTAWWIAGVGSLSTGGSDQPSDYASSAMTQAVASTVSFENLDKTSGVGARIFTDVGSSTSRESSYGGSVGNIVDSSDTSNTVGLMFYDQGIAVYDLNKIMSGSQPVSGTINAVTDESASAIHAAGFTTLGLRNSDQSTYSTTATFIPDLMYSGSIDNILDHIGSCRFQSGSYSAMTFQNVTNINSTLIFCRATADEFNYSSNPTFTDTEGRINVIDEGEEDTQKSFTFITTVGLYDANNNLLAVGKLSRPVEKNDEKDLTVRLRLDFVKRSTNIRLNHRRN